MLIRRGIEDELRDILGVSRAAAIVGPRQVGKSTLAEQLRAAGLLPNYFSLDNRQTRHAALEDPDGFVLSLARPAVIDEVQRAPELMLSIKQILDHDRTPGQFLLTGSADLITSRTIADALPGRVEYVNLWPFAQAELAGTRSAVVDSLLAGEPPRVTGAPKGRAAVAEAVVSGGFPDALDRTPAQRSRYFRSYVQTVLGRDLPDVGDVRVDSAKLDRPAGFAGGANRLACQLRRAWARARARRQDDQGSRRAALPAVLAVQAASMVDEPRVATGQDAEAVPHRQRPGRRPRGCRCGALQRPRPG